MTDRGPSDDDRRELYDQLLELMRSRVTAINSQLQALSEEIAATEPPPDARALPGEPRAIEERIVDEFAAQDAEGNGYQIQVVRGFPRPNLTSPGAAEPADIRLKLRTSDGRPVNRVDFGTYQIVDGSSSTEIWSSDPKAL